MSCPDRECRKVTSRLRSDAPSLFSGTFSHFRQSYKVKPASAAALTAVGVLLLSVTVSASVGLYRQRMEAMNHEKAVRIMAPYEAVCGFEGACVSVLPDGRVVFLNTTESVQTTLDNGAQTWVKNAEKTTIYYVPTVK